MCYNYTIDEQKKLWRENIFDNYMQRVCLKYDFIWI